MRGHSPQRRIPRRGERGAAVLMIVAFVALAIGATGAISYFEGLATLKRLRAQIRAESVALGAAVATRTYGPEVRCEGDARAYLSTLYQLNGGDGVPPCPLLETRNVSAETNVYGLDASETAQVQARVWQFNVDATVERSGRALRIYELVADEFERELGNIQLVLDYSRSMEEDNRIVFLRNAVAQFVGDIENVKVGATLFATNVLNSVNLDVAEDAHTNALSARVNNQDVDRTEGSGTNYRRGLDHARTQLNNELVGGKTIIFISDGRPTLPQPEAEAETRAIAAGDAVHADEIDIFGLFVGNNDDAAVMRRIVDGPPPGLAGRIPPERLEEKFLQNPNAAEIANFFADLVVDFVCRIPITDALELEFPDHETSVWVRTDASDTGIPVQLVATTEDMFGNYNDPVTGEIRARADEFRYSIQEAPPELGGELSLYISRAACQYVEDEGNELVFRAGFARSASPDDGVL